MESGSAQILYDAVQVVFYVGVQLDVTKKVKPCEAASAAERAPGQPEIVPGEPSGKDIVAQRGVCGAVRVACRGLCPSGLRRSSDYQCPLRPSLDHQRDSDEVRPPFRDIRNEPSAELMWRVKEHSICGSCTSGMTRLDEVDEGTTLVMWEATAHSVLYGFAYLRRALVDQECNLYVAPSILAGYPGRLELAGTARLCLRPPINRSIWG